MSKKTKIFLISLLAIAAVFSFLYWLFIPAFKGLILVPAAIDFGFVNLRLYSLTTLIGIFAAFYIARTYASRFGVVKDDLETLFLLSVLFGLLGARAHHVLSLWSLYSSQPSMIWQFWRGGLGFFGGIFGAVSACVIYCRLKKLDLWRILDLLAFVAPLGQAVGRFGNFFNQEAYGLPTSLPWKMYIDIQHRLPAYWSSDFFHPVFLYESLLDLGIFLLLLRLVNKGQLWHGSVFAFYLIVYSLVRFFLEPLRADANMIYGFYSNQLLALVFLGLGLGAYIISMQTRKNRIY